MTRLPAGGEYVPAAETKVLMAGSLAARQERLGAADMVGTEEAARLMQTTRAIGLAQTERGDFRMPRWQFQAPMWNALPRLSSSLDTSQGWALLSFLESPHGALNGMTPRQAIEQGQSDRVIKLAKHEGN